MHYGKHNTRVSARSADFVLRVTAGSGVCLQGQIEHVQSGQVQQFRSCLEMIYLITDKLAQSGFPQPAMEPRTWSQPFKGGNIR